MVPTGAALPDPPSTVGWTSTELGAHLRGRRVKDTTPELRLRRAVHALGLRYRLGRRIGRYRPDMVFPGSNTVVFVDGCFWHGCPEHGPTSFRGPNAARWAEKLMTNKRRDGQAVEELRAAGWHVVRIWECAVKRDVGSAAERVRQAVQRDCAADTSV